MSFAAYARRRAGESIGVCVLLAVASVVFAADAWTLHGAEQLTPLALLGLLAVGVGKFLLQIWREWLLSGRADSLHGSSIGLPSDFLLRLHGHISREDDGLRELSRTITTAMQSHVDALRQLALHQERVVEYLGRLEQAHVLGKLELRAAVEELGRQVRAIDDAPGGQT